MAIFDSRAQTLSPTSTAVECSMAHLPRIATACPSSGANWPLTGVVSASLRGRGRSGLLVVTLLCCTGHDHASPPRLPSPPSTPPFLAQAAATGSRHIDMWWKPQNSSTLVSDTTSMRHVFSISGVIIYCGLAILDNGTVGYPPALWWGHTVLCPAAIAAAGEAGLNIQIILEGRVTAPCPPPPMPVLARRLIMNGTTCLRCKDGDNCSALSACPVGPPSNPRHSTCCSGHTALCHCSNGGTVECKEICQCKQSMCPPPPPSAPPPPCNGIELAFQRGGKAVGAEAMRLVQSMNTSARYRYQHRLRNDPDCKVEPHEGCYGRFYIIVCGGNSVRGTGSDPVCSRVFSEPTDTRRCRGI